MRNIHNYIQQNHGLEETNMDEGKYKTMYPTSCISQSFMGYQKSTKVAPLGLLYLAGVL